MSVAWGGVPLSVFRRWGQNFPGERKVRSQMDTAASPWQEWPISKTESPGAGEMWGPQGIWPQTISTTIKVLECKIFQNLTPHKVGPWQHFEPHLCLDIAHLIHDNMSPSLLLIGKAHWDGSWYPFLKGPVTILRVWTPNSGSHLLIIHPSDGK